MNNEELADYLSSRLNEEGFIVHRYNAISTSSIYLKLDFGVCNSIRISDHTGKKHLKYRYNIGAGIKKQQHINDKFDRYYFPSDEADKLIDKILNDRKWKVKRYGEQKYKEYVEDNKKKSLYSKGFWQGAKEVTVV